MTDQFLNDDLDDGHLVPRATRPPQDPVGTANQCDPLIPDQFMEDPDPLVTTMLCINCRAPLYRIYSRVDEKGFLKSTKTESLGPWKYDKKNDKCPVCGGCDRRYRENLPPQFLTSKGLL